MTKRTRFASRRKRSNSWLAVLAAVAVLGAVMYIALQRSMTTTPVGGAISQFPHIHGMAFDPRDPDVLWLGTHGMLIKVINRTRWIRVGNANYDLMGFNVHPTLAGVLLTSGHPGPRDRRPNPLGVEISRDAGLSWTPVSMEGLVDFHAMSVSTADPQVIYAWSTGSRPGFYRSADGGRSWSLVPARALGQVFALAASPTNPREIVAATDIGLLRSRDAGKTWTPVSADLSGVAVTAVAIHSSQPEVWYAYGVAPQLGFVRSPDAGKTWKPIGFFLGERDAVGYLAVHPTDPKVLYMATFESHLFWSDDGGKTRQQLVRAGRVITP
jgi:hypothetical protein